MNWKALIYFQPQASLKHSSLVTQERQEKLFIGRQNIRIKKRDKYALIENRIKYKDRQTIHYMKLHVIFLFSSS